MRARVALVAAAVAVLVVATASPAAAHAELQTTAPADGATVAGVRLIELVFTDVVEAAGASVRVFDVTGREVPTGPVRQPDGRPEALLVSVAPLPASGYAVAWRVASGDAHPLDGTFAFRTAPGAAAPAGDAQPSAAGGHGGGGDGGGHGSGGHGSAGTPPADRGAAGGATPEAALAASLAVGDDGSTAAGLLGGVRFVAFLALVVLLGGAAFVLTLWPQGRRDRRVAMLLAVAWSGAVLASAAAVPLQTVAVAGGRMSRALGPAAVASALETRFGAWWSVRVVLLVVGGPLLVAALRWSGRRGAVAALASGACGIGVLAATAAAGHAGVGARPLVAVAVGAVHLAGVATWIGGLVVLGAVVLRRVPADGIPVAARRFSGVAAGAVAAVVVTGTVMAARQAGSVEAVTATSYGRLVVGKSAIFAAMVALGAYGRHLLRRRGARGASASLRRSVLAEVALGTVALVVAAVLASSVPGDVVVERRERQATASPAASTETGRPASCSRSFFLRRPPHTARSVSPSAATRTRTASSSTCT